MKELFYRAYKASVGEAWPFHILPPQALGNKLTLQWEVSYLYPGDAPVYAVELSREPNFSERLVDVSRLRGTSYELDMLPEDSISCACAPETARGTGRTPMNIT